MILSYKAAAVALFISIALNFVAFEGSLIYEGVADKFALAVCIVELKLPFIEGAIFFYIGSFAMRLALNPLAKVDRSIAFIDFAQTMRNAFLLDEDRTTLSSWPR